MRYQVGAELAKRRVEIRYDPEALDEVEVYHDGRFVQRAKPFAVSRHRRAKSPALRDAQSDTNKEEPAVNWLAHLTEKRRKKGFIEPTPRQIKEARRAEREATDKVVVSVLMDALDPAVLDEDVIALFLATYGPFDTDLARKAIASLTDAPRGRQDHHIDVYLNAIRTHHKDRA